MKSDFHEKRQRRLDRAEELAAKNEKLAESNFQTSSNLASQIPFGQPILIGHHSEGKHRRHIAKVTNLMDKGVESLKKSEYYADKADAIKNNRSISSDDPDSIEKLKQKLGILETKQEMYLKINKIVKNKKISSDQKKAQLMSDVNLKETTADQVLEPDHCGRIGIPDYITTNNRANMTRIRKRIEQLEKISAIPNQTFEFDGGSIVVDTDDNRVKIIFDSKPDESIRIEMRRNGFHWAPSQKAWIRLISDRAIYLAKQIVKI